MSNQNQYSGWGEWTPTDDHTSYYRARQDANGNYHYEYYDEAAPRGGVDDITAAVGDVNIRDDSSSTQEPGYGQHEPNYGHQGPNYGHHGPGYGQDGSYGQDPDYAYSMPTRPAGVETQSAYTGDQNPQYSMSPPRGPSQGHAAPSSRKGKGVDTSSKSGKKGHRDNYREKDPKSSSSKKHHRAKETKEESYGKKEMDPFYAGPSVPNPVEEPGVVGAPSDAALEGSEYATSVQYQGLDVDPSAPDAYGSGYVQERYTAPGTQGPSHQSVHPKSRKQGKQAVTDAAPPFPGPDGENVDVESEFDGYDPGVSGYHAGYVPEYENEDGRQTPTQGDANNLAPYPPHTSYPAPTYPGQPSVDPDLEEPYPYQPYTTDPDFPPVGYTSGEEHDDRYVVEKSSRFAPGEVFKVYWSEPRGSAQADGKTVVTVEERDHLGKKFYYSFRRFIVVANDEGHCTCVPILTYEFRGCTKKGVKPQKHGIVYPYGGRPYALKNEPELGFQPVRLELDFPTEKLARESRVNYSKLVTIEHNIQVFFIGRIIGDDFGIVTDAVDDCWKAKLRERGSESSRKPRREHRDRDHRDREHRDRRR